MIKWIEENESRVVQIRRYLHRHPEIGYKEYNTSDYLKSILQQGGYDIVQNEAMGTGFFCEYGDGSGPVFALRCDLDALPVQDEKEVEYRSRNDGVMHACGHDVHMAIVTGLALCLRETAVQVPGRIRMIFQPAEEQAPGGALQMIEAGAVKGVDHLTGIHVFPGLATGKIGIREGVTSAAVKLLDFSLHGPGGHTSRPGETVNLISATARLISGLENILAGEFRDRIPAVLSFGKIEGGHTFNVIPSEIALRGTLRYVNGEIDDRLEKIIQDQVDIISRETGADIDYRIPYSVPMVKNDTKLTTLLTTSAEQALGGEKVTHLEKPSMGSDDFGFYCRKTPSVFFRVGCARADVQDLHVPNFDVDESCIAVTLRVLTSFITNYYKMS